jgi:hypothetical protein
MTTKINNITSLSIGEARVGTVVSGSSILASSTAFVANFLSDAGYVINKSITAIITGTKSFATLILINGLASATTSIGTVNATAVNILSSSNALAQVILKSLTQPLEVSNATNTWSIMPVVAFDQQEPTKTFNILQAKGNNTNTDNGTRINFTPIFSVGCVPRVFICSGGTSNQTLMGAYNVTNTGFNVASASNNIISNWFALGY